MKNTYLRLSLIFGSIAAAMVVLYFVVVQYGLKEAALTQMGFPSVLITLTCSLFGMGYFRDRMQGRVLHFWQGALIGIEISLISSLVAGLIVYLIISLIDKSIFPEFIELTRKNLLKDLLDTELQKNELIQKTIKDRLQILPLASPSNTLFAPPTGIFVKTLLVEILLTGMIAAMMRKNVSHLGQPADTPTEVKK